ncbi:MAG: glucose-1-phosphate cytidylyltransferase [Coriobacteriales bacterium]|nr:glucose-1-phosphate cytidylyltransferase [Coriobacteriales bacterium]
MKVVILAGGYGTRISEESRFRPKPMVEIGGMPILWHIMKGYSHHGFRDFVVCAGYKQHVIKEWFADYFLHTSDVTFDFTGGSNELVVHERHVEPWRVTIVDTGLDTNTGGRVRRVARYLGGEPFMLTYGDGVGDVNIQELLGFHRSHGRLGTISTYRFAQNKGVVGVGPDGVVGSFREKADFGASLINIGFMVLEPEVLGYIDGDGCVFEQGPMAALVREGQLAGYVHRGFWQCMDTLRERRELERLWQEGNPPWKIWD